MKARETMEPCRECPVKNAPVIDRQVGDILHIYRDVQGVGEGLTESIIQAYYPDASRFEFLQIVKAMSIIKETYLEHSQRKYEKPLDGRNTNTH